MFAGLIASAIDMLRARWPVNLSSSGVPRRTTSSPWSAPKNTTSRAPSLILDLCRFEDVSERSALPIRVADRAREERKSVVSQAFHRANHGLALAGPQIFERE